ncbi:MAG: ribonuclease HIII [Candidatus Aminicenantia bacterium]
MKKLFQPETRRESNRTNGWIGTDESGKGDYFGPLVVAGVYVRNSQDEKRLEEIGTRDSKKISDRRIIELARTIKEKFINSIVLIGPERYNQLYEKLKNLNRILAWAHARVIENILERVECSYAITDQFGDKNYVLNALMRKGKNIYIHQQPGAEEDLAVAAASILARAEFLKKIDSLSQEIGVNLLKGSSREVENLARELVKNKGKEILNRITKRHFKITRKILGD